MKSVLDMKSLDEFLTLASMSNKTFEAEKMHNTVMVNENQIIDPKAQEKKFIDAFYAGSTNKAAVLSLRIPRKPKWTKETTKQELQNLENVL